MKSVQICNEIIDVIIKQIKIQKWMIILSPFMALIFGVRAMIDPYIRNPIFILLFSIIIVSYVFILFPLVQGNLLKNVNRQIKVD
jgi:hypothetical protein